MNKFKVAVLSVMAVMAISGAGASSASAAEGTVVVTGAGGFTGTQVGGGDSLTLPGGRLLTCETLVIEGVVANGAKTITATPTFAKCHTVVGTTTLVVHVNPTSCDYTFSDLTTTAANTYAATAALSCPQGQAMHITITNEAQTGTICEYTVDPQSGLAGVHFTDNANNTLNIRWTEVPFNVTRTFGTVPNCGGAATTSKLNGDTLVTPNAGTTIEIDD